MSLLKGARRERELVNLFYDAGFGVTRVPKSGGGTKRELPDILAGNGDIYYAIEAKASSGDPIYLDSEEVVALVYFSRNFGARPKVGVRFDREAWYFFHPDDLHKTPEKRNYRVKKERAVEGETFEELTNPRSNDSPNNRGQEILRAVSSGSLTPEQASTLLS